MKFKCFKIISLLVQFFIDIPHFECCKTQFKYAHFARTFIPW